MDDIFVHQFTIVMSLFSLLAYHPSVGGDAGKKQLLEWSETLGVHGPKIAAVLKEEDITWEDLPLLTDAHLEKYLRGGPLVVAQAAVAALKGTSFSSLPSPRIASHSRMCIIHSQHF